MTEEDDIEIFFLTELDCDIEISHFPLYMD